MKAKDYYSKYKDDFQDAFYKKDEKAINETIIKILTEMNHELFETTERRHVRMDRSVLAAIKEMNQKWNALIRIFEKEKVPCFMKPDGFKEFWMKQLNIEAF